jgi:hypothetical protein
MAFPLAERQVRLQTGPLRARTTFTPFVVANAVAL